MAIAPTGPLVTRGRRPKAVAPISTTEVRRSTRSNKYNGFRVTQPSDTRTASSKVKPRITPSAGSSSNTEDRVSDEIPPPTPIPVLQAIGVNRCVVPAEELSEEALLAAPVVVAASTASTPPSEDPAEHVAPNSD